MSRHLRSLYSNEPAGPSSGLPDKGIVLKPWSQVASYHQPPFLLSSCAVIGLGEAGSRQATALGVLGMSTGEWGGQAGSAGGEPGFSCQWLS